MIQVITYRLIPFLPSGTPLSPLNSLWLREAINQMAKKNKAFLESKGADTSLFYNHVPGTSRNRIGYPLIIYYATDGLFFITGIGEGAKALPLLAALYQSPFKIENVVFDGFGKAYLTHEWETFIAPQLVSYALIEWIPVHFRQLPSFKDMNLAEKVAEMNGKLFKHISEEMGKYLNISFENLTVEIKDITKVYPTPLVYKGHEYQAYDIEFVTNAVLPPYLTLGNNKSMGYGRIIPL
jgi:hypothetical protein